MIFYCKMSSWMESLNGPETVKERTDVDWDIWSTDAFLYEDKKRKISPSYDNENFTDLVEKYTRRTLTFDSDILNAFAGIAHQLSTCDPPTYSFAGLPYVPWVDAISREKLIGLTLDFDTFAVNGVPERRPGFPSWTWAGWKGSVYWLYGRELDDIIPTLTNIRFESADPPGHEESITSELTQSFLDSVIVISFDARLVPMEYIAFDEDWTYRHDRLFMGKRSLEDWCGLSVSTVAQKLEKGLWSCVILTSTMLPGNELMYNTFVYVIEWQDGTTATRLGVMRCLLEPSVWQKLQKVEQTRVRLV